MKIPKRISYVISYISVVFLILLVINSSAAASLDDVPTQKWRTSTPESQGLQSKMLADMMAEITKSRYNIDSVLVARNGVLVLEAYFHPFSKGLRHNIYSCTKSIMSALIGIAIAKGHIKSVNQPIKDFFADKVFADLNEAKKSITLENLLMMASGLDCRDSYLYNWKGFLEMKNSGDWLQHVLKLPMAGPPGKSFEYCNGVSYLLSAIIQNTTKMKTLGFARKYLFDPLGISEVVWEKSPQGIDVGWGEMWLKPEDMAKFGLLYLNKGRWGQKQIVPGSWVAASTRGHIDAKPRGQYGYHWWVAASGAYMAVGYYGQFIFVVPDKNLVVVFTGDLPYGVFFIPVELLLKYIIPAATSPESLPANSQETHRLAGLVESAAASADGLIWLSKKEGVANDGLFERAHSPKFRFTYPRDSKKETTVARDQIMRMKTPDGVHFEASLIDIPDKVKLKDFGLKIYAKFLQRSGSDVEVLANKQITLKCGTKAYRTDIKWAWKNYELTSSVVSAYKNDRCVYIAIHPMRKSERFAAIVESLTFE
jgi:CubicO group peptidase (beta-lactamase class C family)